MKDNKLIAEFYDWMEGLDTPQTFTDDLKQDIIDNVDASWGWLMPVVNKCMQTGDNTDEWDALYDALSTVNKTNIQEAVVEFIKQIKK